jgi:hypothetical protein
LARTRARGRWQCGEQRSATGGVRVRVRVLWLCSGAERRGQVGRRGRRGGFEIRNGGKRPVKPAEEERWPAAYACRKPGLR